MAFTENKSFQFNLSSHFVIKNDKEATVNISREITAIYNCHIIIQWDLRLFRRVIILISENQILFM